MSAAPPLRLHASAVVIGEAGILIRGPSGAGKSTLALALVGLAQSQDRFARLIADDRTEIAVKAGRLLAAPVPPIEGLVERRGLGLTPEPHLAAAVLRLVIDCGSEPERMPEPEALVETVAGITLPRLSVLPRAGDERLILTALALFAGSD
ncbi:HPr Serine kinase C-terminal domain-containing protein [Bosea lupini]|jgi:HPr kinase/phosphorylase|uniref:HPr Serine kinase C-terminal domain-containing protein n=1 Tax=Bosea lupini TaxID=1036779 RepID=A0A1H7RLY5_9HYPH|nr:MULTISPECIES: HPr kinase/phosphatase C-terminal domain-containing protein [Bosea]SEL61048.1 HPr Serine kinase C-terminal domain-containing protein [Bosea lupini]